MWAKVLLQTPPLPLSCSCHQLSRPDLGGETLTYPQTWEWGEKGVGSALRLSETPKTARLLMAASHPSQHVISFIPWSAVSSHHLCNYAKCLPFVGHTSHLQHPCANTFKTKHSDIEITATKCLHKSRSWGKPSRDCFSTSVKQIPKRDLGLANCTCGSYICIVLVSVCYQLCCRRAVNRGIYLSTHIGQDH